MAKLKTRYVCQACGSELTKVTAQDHIEIETRRKTASTAIHLVKAQIAIALVLLAGAGLMAKSAMRLYDTPIGVDASRVLTL